MYSEVSKAKCVNYGKSINIYCQKQKKVIFKVIAVLYQTLWAKLQSKDLKCYVTKRSNFSSNKH